MAKKMMTGYRYGSRFDGTRHITDLETLARRMLADFAVLDSAECEAAGVGIELQVYVYGNTFMEICLWGLTDKVVFRGRPPALLTTVAKRYEQQVTEFIQSYGWSRDGGRRRFFALVNFMEEREWRSKGDYDPVMKIID
ncbi:hypothetical protein [Kutzneria buriramensis]|uniref:Uncharacterized protein n=1 Tax=Kutzneria buriramensis TaxID=1045776 RepID=A0A3E0HD32_9PSEU|nr:hypothetical protein [Kutzneria buriramensis]REH42703.1 hypothetical protein BCF44_110200 [Kutzneria buriramensis]